MTPPAGFASAAARCVAGEVTRVLRDAIGAMRAAVGRVCPACGGGNAADATSLRRLRRAPAAG